jgi:hypothetical protein
MRCDELLQFLFKQLHEMRKNREQTCIRISARLRRCDEGRNKHGYTDSDEHDFFDHIILLVDRYVIP